MFSVTIGFLLKPQGHDIYRSFDSAAQINTWMTIFYKEMFTIFMPIFPIFLESVVKFEKVINLVFLETAFKTSRQSNRSKKPVKFHHDLSNEQMEDAVASVANSTPELHLFTGGGKFDIAQVSRDGHVIDLELNEIEKALCFSCVYTMSSTFASTRAISQFMGFFQFAIMCEPYESKKSNPHVEFLKKFDDTIQSVNGEFQLKKYAC